MRCKYILLGKFDRCQKGEESGMDAIINFLFNTPAGVAVLFVGGIVVFIIISAVMEKGTHRLYVDRGPKSSDDDGDDWTL